MLEIKGVHFEVEIIHKKIKNLYLRLDGNKVVATAPMRMPDYEVYKFIDARRNWIYKTYERMNQKKEITKLYHGGDLFYLFGKPYHLVRNIGNSKVSIRDDTIFLTYKDDSEDGIRYLYKYLDKTLLKKAEELKEQYLPFLQDYGYMEIPELKCRIMKSKWGVCYVKKNRITISSYLIHYPEECLEYIMIHEMTHFIVPNHSPRFYDIVSGKMPDYKRVSAQLI